MAKQRHRFDIYLKDVHVHFLFLTLAQSGKETRSPPETLSPEALYCISSRKSDVLEECLTIVLSAFECSLTTLTKKILKKNIFQPELI